MSRLLIFNLDAKKVITNSLVDDYKISKVDDWNYDFVEYLYLFRSFLSVREKSNRFYDTLVLAGE